MLKCEKHININNESFLLKFFESLSDNCHDYESKINSIFPDTSHSIYIKCENNGIISNTISVFPIDSQHTSVAYLSFDIVGKYFIYIKDITVSRGMRKRGIASLLLNVLDCVASEFNIGLSVGVAVEDSIYFWLASGYKISELNKQFVIKKYR